MMDFRCLKLIVNESYSFVGIKKQANELIFCLPKGFEKSISSLNTFSEKRNLFFLFYGIFDTFKDICLEKGYLQEPARITTSDRDGIINQVGGSEIELEDAEPENILYSKLDLIGYLINAYDEPKILSLAYRLGKGDSFFDVSKIHRYLHKAIYLKNNAAYVDEVLISRRSVKFEATDIVAMYCYLYCEINQQLAKEVDAEVLALGERFRQHYLRSSDSIFDEQSYEQVLNTLKDTLDQIDHNTALKDADYWQYYEAIELFIYGDWNQAEEGEIWGVKNFHSIWESMCLTYLVDTTDPRQLLHIDDTYLHPQTLTKLKSSRKTLHLSNTFRLNGSSLNPDAVIISVPSNHIDGDQTYTLSTDNWNDYGYRTFFNFKDINISYARIAYAGQEDNEYTLNSLSKYYRYNKQLIVDSRLPSKYYSYWKIKDLNHHVIHGMHYFNHFFYLALEKSIKSWREFSDCILKPLDIKFGSQNNIFSASLFRDCGEAEVRKDFEDFVQKASALLPEFIKIIDIKYLNQDYLQDQTKIEEIKRRSVRKQFVYEYLLQKTLEREQSDYRNLSINSSFWIPDNRLDDPEIMEVSQVFLDGFLELQKINFLTLAKNYLS